MRAASVVVVDELLDDPAEVTLVEWNQVVQTLPPDGPDQALAVRIRYGSLARESEWSVRRNLSTSRRVAWKRCYLGRG